LVRLDPKEHPVLGQYVLVRVTDMSGIDLNTYEFDCDLTFCGLIMKPDGQILHTYGGRDENDAESHLSVASLLRVLEQALPEVGSDSARSAPPGHVSPLTVENMPPMARRIRQGKKPDCVHCHTVNEVRTEWARERKEWRQERAFRWPDPIQIGLRLEKTDQAFIREVISRSPAAKAKLRKGDRLRRMSTQPILTYGDVARVLHDTPSDGGSIDVVFTRDGKEMKGKIRVKKGWRVPTPEVFAWRPSKWPLSPKPGFGGPQLSPADLKRKRLPAGSFAFRVGYLVTWGPNRRTGLNARKAGIQKGDVVIRVGGKNDFRSMDHFHAWFRLTRKVGEVVPIEIIRSGKRKLIRLKTVE